VPDSENIRIEMLQRSDPHVHLYPDHVRWTYQTDFVFETTGRDTPAGYTWSLIRKGVTPTLKGERRWEPFASGQTARCYGAVIGREPAGFVEFSIDGTRKETRIVTLVVAEPHRRLGIARKLMEVVEAAGRHAKTQRIVTECEARNMPGLEVLRRLGFEYSGFSGDPAHPEAVMLSLSKAQK
jgi:ribosomal protein S18 acetylase RimI-like enzyme